MQVSLADCPLIMGDQKRLDQLFNNLAQNSARYTDSGGVVNIQVSQQFNNCLISWSDSAPGVLEHDLPHLFERLYRAEKSRNRETGGSGLGLAICENIVLAHNGEITAKHSALGGLTIEISLPLNPEWAK